MGAISGRVLDDLIRHASVLGLKPFTRSDAVLSAAMKDEMRIYKCSPFPCIHALSAQVAALLRSARRTILVRRHALG